MVVPILAPIMMGMALDKVMEFDATRATTMAVVVELLWMRAVINKPINNPVKGLDVAKIMVSTAFFPKCCKELIIRSKANMKRRNDKKA